MGLIAGIAGGAAILTLAVLALFFYIRGRKKDESDDYKRTGSVEEPTNFAPYPPYAPSPGSAGRPEPTASEFNPFANAMPSSSISFPDLDSDSHVASVAALGASNGAMAVGAAAGLSAKPSGVSEGSGSGSTLSSMPSVPTLDWIIPPDQIKIMRKPDGSDWKLGAGAFGTVYKALRSGVSEVAVKVLKEGQSERQRSEFMKEVAILKGCHDQNIVQFLGVCQKDADTTWLVTEFMLGGDLYHALSKLQGNEQYGWYRKGQYIALDVARGLHFLHAHRIVHFDLKSANVLLTREGVAKIADVGFARVMNSQYVSRQDTFGTFAWAAPEIFTGQRCTEKVDIYSYGVVLWELVTHEVPQRGRLRTINVPAECPQWVRDVTNRCLALNPKQRPSAKQIVEMITANTQDGRQ